MDEKSADQQSHLSLFLAADRKIDEIRNQLKELYERDQSNQEKLDKLRERLEMGVGRTSRSTADKVSELVIEINGLAHRMASSETTIQHHERLLGRLVGGVFWFSFTGLLGGLLGLAYQIVKIKLLGSP